jgi:hypothetical protein
VATNVVLEVLLVTASVVFQSIRDSHMYARALVDWILELEVYAAKGTKETTDLETLEYSTPSNENIGVEFAAVVIVAAACFAPNKKPEQLQSWQQASGTDQVLRKCEYLTLLEVRINVSIYPRTIGYFQTPTPTVDTPDTAPHRMKDAFGPTQLRSPLQAAKRVAP